MPYTTKNPPDRIKELPKEAINIWVNAFNSAYDQYKKDEELANRTAWSVVKKKYKKEGDKWVKMKSSEGNIRMMFPSEVKGWIFSEKDNTTIQIFQTGLWKHPAYGKIKIGLKELDDFVSNFTSGIRRKIPITAGHAVDNDVEPPAIGWFKEIINKGQQGLWATVEWTKEGKRLLEEKAYRYFSPEFYSIYEDPETHKIYKNVLVGGALTNHPYFKGLKAIVLSESILTNEKMTLEEILKKNPEDLTDEEVKFLKDNEGDIGEEDKNKFKDVLVEGEEEEEKDEEEEEEEDKKEASEVVSISKKKLSFLERNSKEGVRAMAILRRKKAEEVVENFVCSETNKNGILLPKSAEKTTTFMLSLTDEQQKKFKEILSEMPKSKMFSEIGTEENNAYIKASEQLDKIAVTKMSENSDLKYHEAVEQAMAENPSLAKAVENE